MEEGFNIAWDDGPTVGHLGMCEEVVVQDIDNDGIEVDEGDTEILYMQEDGENDENVVYMHTDEVLVDQTEEIAITEDGGYIECQVAEEVITDDWANPQNDDRYLKFMFYFICFYIVKFFSLVDYLIIRQF